MLFVFKKNPGFTLIEILVTMTIFVLVVFMAGDFIISGFKSINFSSEQSTAIENARRATEIVSQEIREAIFSERGDYPLAIAENQQLSFYADINSDSRYEKVRYFLEDKKLKRGLIEPGSGHDYSGAESVTDVANYVNNQTEPIFSFYNSSNTTASLINEIRMINFKIKINVNPAIAPQDYYVETDIQLRNLKDNL
jgi:prepilin-type N-terminal cleavage/methylation domain-containing protein